MKFSAVLVDSSVWISHFKKSDDVLQRLLELDLVYVHEFILAELAAGIIPNRKQTLNDLRSLKIARPILYSEILTLINSKKLYGKGLSAIDIHILGSCLADSLKLFTHDKLLGKVAAQMGIAV